jgi:pentatricopeptide repeat protein
MPPYADLNLTALCRENRLKEALHILITTHKPPGDSHTYLQLLQICIAKNNISLGKKIHSFISQKRFAFSVRSTFQNKFIDMYVKCGSLNDAHKMFDEMKEQNVSSWNTMIAAYRKHGFPREALTLFHQMQRTGVEVDEFTFSSILPACGKLRFLEQGIDIHQSIIERGFLSDVVVASALVDMYAKCGSIYKARSLFDKMPQKNVVSWNAMIVGYTQNGVLEEALKLFNEMSRPDVVSWSAIVAGYAKNGFFEDALEAFKKMQLAGYRPNPTTFVSILPACAKMGALEQGMDIHQIAIDNGFSSDVMVMNALIDMYAKCGDIQKARDLFDKMSERDVISWTSMVAGYAHNGFVEQALQTFKQMQRSGLKPDSTTLVTILPACARLGGLEQGMSIHRSILESNFLSDVVAASALVDMYAKCGSIHKAHDLFDKMPQRDVASWNAMIAGCAQNGFVEKAFETFKKMTVAAVKPDSTTFASILPLTAELGGLEQGRGIHEKIIESGILSDVIVANALTDMYAKCGSIYKASKLFNKMPRRDVISWNVIISGYAQNGLCNDALELFELMKHSGIYPDHISYTCVLFACSHAGLMDEGFKYFTGMSDSYCIKPTIDHYVCITDLLSRGDYLEETLNFIIKMPIKPVEVVWTCLLGVCRSHKNIELGVFTATVLLELDPKDAATYVLLSNIYAEMGRWHDVQMIRRLMKERGIIKLPGCSWIESYKMVHAFLCRRQTIPMGVGYLCKDGETCLGS